MTAATARSLPKVLACFVAAALIFTLVPSADAGVTRRDRYRARLAVRYIVDQQQPDGSFVTFSTIGSTADGILALAAARRAPDAIGDAVEYLETNSDEVDAYGEIARVALALDAVGTGARDFAGRDLVAELEAGLQEGGRLGSDNPFSEVYDHIQALLALAAADRTIASESVEWLLQAQCPDGGWQFDKAYDAAADDNHCFSGEGDYSSTDTNTTSYAIQALEAIPGVEDLQANPFAFLRTLRDPQMKGWGFDRNFNVTDANSTALVIQAFVAGGKLLPRGSKAALRRLQYRPCSSGQAAFAFSYTDENEDGELTRSEKTDPDLGATIGAVPGLLEKPFPLQRRDITRAAPRATCP